MQYYFKRFFVLHSSEVIFSFLIKKLRQKAIEIEIALGSYDGYVKHKRNDPLCDPWDSQGDEKMLFLLLFALY